MACTGQPVAAHAAVVFLLVGGLSATAQSHDDISRTDIGVVDDVATFHAACHGGVYDDGAHQVAHVGCLAARGIDADTHLAHLGQQFVRTVDDGTDDFARDEHFVTSDSGRHQDVVYGTHTKQIVRVHDERVLRNAFPYGQVARFFPVRVGQRRFRAGSVGVHDVAVFRVTAQNVGDNLAECLREDTLIDVLDGVVYVLFGCRHAAHHVTLVTHITICF